MYIEYINDVNEQNNEKLDCINTSDELNEIANKLLLSLVQSVADYCIGKDSGRKKPLYDEFLNGLMILFSLLKQNKPVYLINNNYDLVECSSFCFFIGTHDEIKNKLEKLYEDRYNRKKENY